MGDYINHHHSVEGTFYLRRGKKMFGREVIIQETGPCRNLITNRGLDRMASGSIEAIVVGSGNTPPTVDDIWLEDYIAFTRTRQGSVQGTSPTAPDYYAEYTSTWRFGEGVAAGNISEVGASWGTTPQSPNLFSRALIVDEFGNPTTLTILPDEFLDVTYKIRVYIDITDKVGVINLDGVDYDYTIRPVGFGTSAWDVGTDQYPPSPSPAWIVTTDGPYKNASGLATTGLLGLGDTPPSQSEAYRADTITLVGYTNGNYWRDIRWYWGLTRGNLTGGFASFFFQRVIKGGLVSQGGVVQYHFSPRVPKDDTKVFTLNTRISWGRRPTQ